MSLVPDDILQFFARLRDPKGAESMVSGNGTSKKKEKNDKRKLFYHQTIHRDVVRISTRMFFSMKKRKPSQNSFLPKNAYLRFLNYY